MAVFTTFSSAALERYLMMFDLGELTTFEAIESGIENSNYYVTLEQDGGYHDFVLTITENLSFEDVPFFNSLFTQLSRAGLPVPNPARTLDGMSGTIFCGKPTWLFPRLPGHHPVTVSETQCRTIGSALARLHQSTATVLYGRQNPYDAAWMGTTLDANRHHLVAADVTLMTDFLATYLDDVAGSSLPAGIIHGDLFRDNAMFDGEELTGVIDFYHACQDFLAQDIAITINEWCSEPNGRIDDLRAKALLDGYESHRKLTREEHAALPLLQKIGAMRFVLTRLLSGEGAEHLKDPAEFLLIARQLP